MVQKEGALLTNLLRKGLVFYTQDIVSANNDCLYSEMLARIEYDGNIYTPLSFLGDMNDSLVLEIFSIGIERMCALQSKSPFRSFGINLNPDLLHRPDVSGRVIESIQAHIDTGALDPRRCIIEITEDAKNPSPLSREAVADIGALRKQGIRFALDDFGDRHSNFSQIILDETYFSIVKIDGIFVKGCPENKIKKREILSGVVGVLSSIGVTVVVEHIECPETFEFVGSLGGNVYCQGYYIQRPAPPVLA